MKSGARRSLVPIAYRDVSSWPELDTSKLSEAARRNVERKMEAIALYVAGCKFQDISAQTQIGEDNLRRVLKRCLMPCGDGQIFGFRALKPGVRVVPYHRRKPVQRRSVFAPNRSAGFAGALGQLFERFPDIRASIIDQFLGKTHDGEYVESKKSIANIHADFIRKLDGRVGRGEWPNNTVNHGYSALQKFLRKLLKSDPEAFINERCGKDALRHLSIGTGHLKLVRAWMPFSILELDYTLQDAPGFIQFEDRYGKLHDVPVARWYVGFLADEFLGAVCGYYIAYETCPSADAALQTVLSSITDPVRDDGTGWSREFMDQPSLIRNILPSFSRQGCCLLKVDNGWANIATDFVNNIIDVLGCAVEFGTPYAWWIRPIVERLNGKLAERGLHRLRCTYGSGPQDSRRRDPDSESGRYKLRDSDLREILDSVIAEHHTVFTPEKLFRSTIADVLADFSIKRELDWIPQPLPTAFDSELRLLMHRETVTVRGSVAKGIRPYVQLDRCRYTNKQLASDFTLLGEKIELQVHRLDVRMAWGVVLRTGMDLGALLPEARWAEWRYSLCARRALNRKALGSPANRDPGILSRVIRARSATLVGQSGKKRSKREALKLAKLQMDVAYEPTLPPGGEPVAPARGLGAAFGMFRTTRGDDDV